MLFRRLAFLSLGVWCVVSVSGPLAFGDYIDIDHPADGERLDDESVVDGATDIDPSDDDRIDSLNIIDYDNPVFQDTLIIYKGENGDFYVDNYYWQQQEDLDVMAQEGDWFVAVYIDLNLEDSHDGPTGDLEDPE